MSTKETYIIEQIYDANTNKLVSETKKAQQSTDKMGDAFDGAKRKISSIISPMNIVAGAMAYASYRTVQAVKDFVAYEKQLSSLNTILQVSKKELNTYGDGFIDLAIKLGSTKEEITAGAYEALSAGVKETDLMNFMETATKGASAGMTSVATSVDVLTSAMNGFGYEGKDATLVMDKLIKIQNQGKIKLGELSTVMGDVADISSGLGISLDEVGASLATITLKGTPVRVAGTRLKAMFSELTKESTEASKTFNELSGKSFKEFIKEGGTLADGLGLMENHARKTNRSMIDLFGSIEAGQGALGITGASAEAFNKNLDGMRNASGELEKAYGIASDNIATDWAKLTALVNSKWLETVVALERPIRLLIEVAYKIVDTVDFINNTKKMYDFMNKYANPVRPIQIGATKVAEDFLAQRRLAQEMEEQQAMKGKGIPATPTDKDIQQQEQLKARSIRREITKKEQEEKIQADKDEQERLEKLALNESERRKAEAEAQRRHFEILTSEQERHRNETTLIENEILAEKIAYFETVKEQFNSGLITKEEYDRLTEEKEKELKNKKAKLYTEQLQDLKDFYLQIGEVFKANEVDRQILELELQVHIDGDFEEDPSEIALRELRERQLEEQRIFADKQIENEWDFINRLNEVKTAKRLSQEEYDVRMAEYKENQRVLEEMFRIAQLEDLMRFYSSQEGMERQALETYEALQSTKQKVSEDDKKTSEKVLYWEQYAQSKKVDVVKLSADAVLNTYTALAKGQIQSLDDFKKFARESVAEIMLQKGQEHMALSISDFGKGLSYLASLNPVIQAKAPQAFLSSAKNAGIATLLGVGASALSGGGDSGGDSTDGSNEKDTIYAEDDEDVNRAKELANETQNEKTRIYVSTEENAMAGAMVKLLEKELNDEYNVSIIGERK